MSKVLNIGAFEAKFSIARHAALVLACVGMHAGAWAVGLNDYESHISVTPGPGAWINGINVDPVSGQVLVAYNHGIRVYPAGAGGQNHLLDFPVAAGGGSGPSPSGAVLVGGNYYASTFYRAGSVYRFDGTGGNETELFHINDQAPYDRARNGATSMAAMSTGDLVLSTLNMPNPQAGAVRGLIVKGVDGSTRWSATSAVPSGDVLQVAVDKQDNVYAAGDGYGQYVQVFDAQGTPLRQIGPVEGPYSAGVAVDRCGFVYVSSPPNVVEKFDPSGQRVARFADTAHPYGTNRGGLPLATDAAGKYLYLPVMGGADYGRVAVWEQTTAPPPPPVLQAELAAGPTIQTQWDAPTTCVTSYAMEISTDGVTWSPVAISGTATERVITGSDIALTPGTTYHLRMTDTDADATSAYSEVVTVTLPPGPAPAPTPVPTASTWALTALGLLLALFGWRRLPAGRGRGRSLG